MNLETGQKHFQTNISIKYLDCEDGRIQRYPRQDLGQYLPIPMILYTHVLRLAYWMSFKNATQQMAIEIENTNFFSIFLMTMATPD